MRLHGVDYDRAGLARMAGDLPAAGGVRSVVLDDGAERGIRVLEFRTGGGLSFDVLVDRAMDIGAADYRGVGFGWRSATGFRHPSLHEYRDEDGLSWLRSFCGLTVTAGLDHTLFTAEVDASRLPVPVPAVGVERAARPGGQHPSPAARLRRTVGRRPVRAVGRGGDPAGGHLRRAPAADPAHRGRPGRPGDPADRHGA